MRGFFCQNPKFHFGKIWNFARGRAEGQHLILGYGVSWRGGGPPAGDHHDGKYHPQERRPGGIRPQPQLQPQPLPGIHAAPRRHRPGESLPRQPHRTHRQLLLGQAHKLGDVPSARARGQAAGPASGHLPPPPRLRPRERGHLHVRGNSLRRCVQEHAQEARPRTPQDGRLPRLHP